ncbi:MAG: PilT/PilU family type 4a pilus ATPase [Deltaproteobacteria bacterium]|nr:PilT/PilU family type 4a pilus ATPase [Deltaproteobacteria bacterium]
MQVQKLNEVLATAVRHGGSDIHIKVGAAVHVRLNGALQSLGTPPVTPQDARAVCVHLVADPRVRDAIDQIKEYDCSYSLPGVGRFRVNIYRQRGCHTAILRIIPTKVPTLAQLGLPPAVGELANTERGIVLVTGATGTGKSTTLAAMIGQINATRKCHIVTIEDPIEYVHQDLMASVSQREIGTDTSTFSIALRAALRQDPDVLLVGEMRDSEAIDIALKASETGHVVYSTVHTTDAAKTIGRLVSVFPTEQHESVRYRLSDNLAATVSQRLLPRADGRGRVVAMEIMRVTKTVREFIRNKDRTIEIKDAIERDAGQTGMQSFDQHLRDLYRKGLITIETAKSAASTPSDFERALYVQ